MFQFESKLCRELKDAKELRTLMNWSSECQLGNIWKVGNRLRTESVVAAISRQCRSARVRSFGISFSRSMTCARVGRESIVGEGDGKRERRR